MTFRTWNLRVLVRTLRQRVPSLSAEWARLEGYRDAGQASKPFEIATKQLQSSGVPGERSTCGSFDEYLPVFKMLLDQVWSRAPTRKAQGWRADYEEKLLEIWEKGYMRRKVGNLALDTSDKAPMDYIERKIVQNTWIERRRSRGLSVQFHRRRLKGVCVIIKGGIRVY